MSSLGEAEGDFLSEWPLRSQGLIGRGWGGPLAASTGAGAGTGNGVAATGITKLGDTRAKPLSPLSSLVGDLAASYILLLEWVNRGTKMVLSVSRITEQACIWDVTSGHPSFRCNIQ